MKKRCYGLIIIILLFVSIPSSFSLDYNTTMDEPLTNEIQDNYIVEVNDLTNEVHVDANGLDDNDGSYEKPFKTINKAISYSSNNSKIIIHEGIYKENNLNITKSLNISSQGNVIIDAENSSRIFTINAGTSDNVILSGITFINGQAYQGGAIYVRNAITSIYDSKFINNSALTEGGSIYWNSPYGNLINSVFENNSARDGSAVSWGGANSTDMFSVKSDHGDIINCTFRNNHIMQDEDGCIGMSIYSDYVNVINSTFTDHNTDLNSSFEVLYINGDYATVSGCIFANNSMTQTSALGLDGNFATAFDNLFFNNTVSFDDSFGGAIGIQSENADIFSNTFISNGGSNCSVGGAIFINTIETFSFNFINITDNIFIANEAKTGAGIYATGKSNMLSLLIENNTFENQNADVAAGIYLTDIYNPVIIKNNTFSNLISQNSPGIYASSCILSLYSNFMENCSSSNGGEIYTDGEVQSDLRLGFSDVVGLLNKTVTLTATLEDDMGNSISTRNINFYVDGEKINSGKGLNSVNVTFDSTGEHLISGEFEKGTASVVNGTLKIVNGANIVVENITSYGGKVSIRVILMGDDGVALDKKRLYLNLNDKNLLLTTDANGIAQTNVDLKIGSYNASVSFNNVNYKPISEEFSINVLSSINASDKIIAYSSSDFFKIQFFDGDGSLLQNASVVFNVNGKEYSLKTDNDGIAILNTKLSAGVYSISATNPSTDESSTYTVEVFKRIIGNKNINMYFGAGNSYKVRIYGDDAKVVGAGVSVKITVAGKSHTVRTDKNGYASFKISLAPKTYTITATYKGYKVSNKIVVKQVLTAKNISKKKAKTVKFTAKLVNTKGKVLKGKVISFKFKGKTYKIKTNKKGIATLTLKNLKVGKYTIKTTYGKSAIKNTIKIRK